MGVTEISSFLAKLRQAGIWILFTPKHSACQTSPLDNSLFSVLKKKIQGKLFKNYSKKFKGVQRALDEITKLTVRNFWKH